MGLPRCERRRREIVEAVVEHAYRGGRQHAPDVHERGAVDAQCAQVGGRFVEHQLKAFAIERRIAFPGQHQPALALAVRDEQLDLGEPFAPLRQALQVVAAGEVGEQLVDTPGLRRKRLLDLINERAFLLCAGPRPAARRAPRPARGPRWRMRSAHVCGRCPRPSSPFRSFSCFPISPLMGKGLSWRGDAS